MVKQVGLYGLMVAAAIIIFPPVLDGEIEVYVLFDFDLLLLLFTGESDPTVLSARFFSWYPKLGLPRLVVSCVLAGLAIYRFWKVDEGEPMLGTTAAGRRAKGFLAEDQPEEDPDASSVAPVGPADEPMGEATAEEPQRRISGPVP